MDMIQDWASYLLLASGTNYPSYFRQFLSTTSSIKSYVVPLLDRITHNPDLATIALVLIILFLSLKILNMLWQAVLFWLRLARRVVVWGGLVVLALWIYNRGPEGAMDDVTYWARIWWQEYQYWKEQAESAKLAHQQGNRQARHAGWY